eukprot:11203880-Lingulodinium_polyedra.AAC.2
MAAAFRMPEVPGLPSPVPRGRPRVLPCRKRFGRRTQVQPSRGQPQCGPAQHAPTLPSQQLCQRRTGGAPTLLPAPFCGWTRGATRPGGAASSGPLWGAPRHRDFGGR